jgi:hypothetical protein
MFMFIVHCSPRPTTTRTLGGPDLSYARLMTLPQGLLSKFRARSARISGISRLVKSPFLPHAYICANGNGEGNHG